MCALLVVLFDTVGLHCENTLHNYGTFAKIRFRVASVQTLHQIT
jgi:hypothetical protein